VVRRTARGILAFLVVTGLGLWAYVESVPLPADPIGPQASDIFFADGHTLLARVGITDRTDVTLAQVPLPVRRAVLAAEDRDFYVHFGLSLKGVIRATWSDVVGGSQGASTITQQYARNAYLTQDRTVSRKAKEMALALKLEGRYSKDEILERYLNAIYFGRGAYGIAAAAQAYFGSPVDQLTVAQGAVLAAVIKDPWNFDPAVDPAAARDRWQWITTSMAGLGWLTRAEVGQLRYPSVLAEAPVATTADGVNGLLVGRVEQELDHAGIPPQLLRTGGLRVTSTVDGRAQNSALSAVAAARSRLDPGIHAALVAVDPATGGVVAYYGGDRGRGYFDDATAPRPAAATFKPVVLAAGLAHGVSYQSTWDGSSPRTFADRGGVPLHNAGNVQCPVCPLDVAMALSLNTPFYALASWLGGSVVRDEAVRLGVPAEYDHQPSLVDGPGAPRPGSTRADIALGIYPVAPADLAGVYATFAAGGVRAEEHFVAAVTSHDGGHVLYQYRPSAHQVITPAVAADVSAVLAEAAAHEWTSLDRPAAAKTGTQGWGDTGENQDAWMAGYTPQLAAVVWVGRPVPGPIDDAAGTPIEGRTVPAAIWSQFLAGALAGRPATAFPAPAHLGRRWGDAHRGNAGPVTPPPLSADPVTPQPVTTSQPAPAGSGNATAGSGTAVDGSIRPTAPSGPPATPSATPRPPSPRP